jgi:adenylosuccinate lyase
MDDFTEMIDDLDVSEAVREELHALTPAGYTGLASDLVDELD